jgi:hypothetical protein
MGGGIDNSRSGIQCPQTSLAVLSDGMPVLRQKIHSRPLAAAQQLEPPRESLAQAGRHDRSYTLSRLRNQIPPLFDFFLEVSPFSVPNVVTKQTKSERLSDKCARLCDYLK